MKTRKIAKNETTNRLTESLNQVLHVDGGLSTVQGR